MKWWFNKKGRGGQVRRGGRDRTDAEKENKGLHGSARRIVASAREERFQEAIRSGFRSVSGLMPIALIPQDLMHLYSYWMYYTNHLYGGIVERKTDIICGDGFYFDSASGDDRVRDEIERFWEIDAINNLMELQDIYVAWTQVFGSLCLTVQTNNRQKDLRVGFVHPFEIERTYVDDVNPFIVTGVKLKGLDDQVLTTVIDPLRSDEELFLDSVVQQRAGFRYQGRQVFCFFMALNPRIEEIGGDGGLSLMGSPPLLSAIDACRDSEEVLFAMRRRADIASRILWDITLKNADDEDIQTFLEDTPLPDENTLNAHNDQAEWKLIAPELNASEHETEHRILRNSAISGKGTGGMPPTWFADGTDVNRANGQEMPFTALKTVKKEQRKFGSLFKRIVEYQLVQKGMDSQDVKGVLPTISERDYERLARTFATLTSSLTVGENQKYVSKEEARQVYRETLEEFGTELGDYEEEEESWVSEDYQRMMERSGRVGREGQDGRGGQDERNGKSEEGEDRESN